MFSVDVNGQISEQGNNVIFFPERPIITGVTGCPTNYVVNGTKSTSNCATAGGNILTVYGFHLQDDVVLFVYRCPLFLLNVVIPRLYGLAEKFVLV